MKLNPIFTNSINTNIKLESDKTADKAAKKAGRKAALASAIIPGYSQFKEGRTATGVAILSSMIVGISTVTSKILSKTNQLQNIKNVNSKNIKSIFIQTAEKFTRDDAIITIGAAAALLIIGSINIIDAYIHGKNKAKADKTNA